MSGLQKNAKNKFSQVLFEIIHIIRFEMHMDRLDKSENISIVKKMHFFTIHSSSRHEKRFQMLQTLFWLFQYSRNMG
jgi:hypothetical protein